MKKEITSPASNSELAEVKLIPESPFAARRYDDKWILTVGKYRTPHFFKTYEEAEHEVKNPSWDTIMTVMQFVINFAQTLNNK